MSKVRQQIQFSMNLFVLLLTVACVGVGIYATRDSSVEVLVATEDLDYKTAITKANAKFEKWPASIIPDGAITASDEFPDGVLTTRLRKGQVIVGKDVIDPAKLPGLAIPRNHCVRNFKAPTALCASLRSGGRVDVVVALNGDDENLESVCEGVRVFNIGSNTPGNETSMIVGVLLDKDQVTAVAEAKIAGLIRLAARGDSEFLD